MREIKFRAWDPESKKMGVPFEPFDPVFMAGGGTFDDSIIFSQFTGLKDKNGKEIYEGDLLQFVSCLFEVRFDRGAFYGDPLAANDIRGHLSCQSFPDALVIGNIYSNPELLKQ